MKTLRTDRARAPFLFGAQYYRAPTPEPSCWEADHARMAALGFNSVKYWLQWRWSHRRGDRFVFDDVLSLMDLAEKHRLAVTLNVIFDVAPVWLYERYPDAKQVMNSGRIVEPETVAHRQIGGSPGPCYRHRGAREEREKFLAAAVETFRGHPALDLWDVWNEPELCFNQRTPDLSTMACYCEVCRADFRFWLERKYCSLDRLNAAWGRCYETWSEVEAPRTALTLLDFVDWREFHLDTLTEEATWRFATVRGRDRGHGAFLHTVPGFVTCFNAVTCSDDFALAPLGDFYGASYNEGGANVPFLTSAAQGKIVYNTEVHLNFGLTNMHQGRIDLPDVLRIFVPQIGMGMRGFQFWQFRAEVLGFEAPGWGVVKPNGGDRPVTRAIEEFWKVLEPHGDALADCPCPSSEVGIWKSRKNEIFHYAIHGSLQNLAESVSPYTQYLYWNNIPYRIVDHFRLEAGDLRGLKFLILPSPYFLTQEEADALRDWVEQGGTLWTEAHLGAYDGTVGRHSREVPGCSLAGHWGIFEDDSTSSYRLKLDAAEAFEGALVSDVEKALGKDGTSGGKYFPLSTPSGAVLWGADRCAFLGGDNLEPLAMLGDGSVVAAAKSIGRGRLYYFGTNCGAGSIRGDAGFRSEFQSALNHARVESVNLFQTAGAGELHVDELTSPGGQRFIAVSSRSQSCEVSFLGSGRFRGLWSGLILDESGAKIVLPALFHDIFVLEEKGE